MTAPGKVSPQSHSQSQSQPRTARSAAVGGDRIGEQLRRVAARSTRAIVLRKGRDLGMVVGCGFPKSGTVWLCQLMSTYLGLPYPRSYRMPIAMASVIHAHWRFDDRLPAAAYIRRDGRDVMVSSYFYYVHALEKPTQPAWSRELRAKFLELYGPGFDPAAVRDNLPKFVEWQLSAPRGSAGLAWHQHVEDWWQRPGVGQLSYERLLADPVSELSGAMATITGAADESLAELAVQRWAFARTAGRSAGEEDRQSFLRKGVAGDWRTHFGREAGEVFDAAAGDALVALGYAADRSWWAEL